MNVNEAQPLLEKVRGRRDWGRLRFFNVLDFSDAKAHIGVGSNEERGISGLCGMTSNRRPTDVNGAEPMCQRCERELKALASLAEIQESGAAWEPGVDKQGDRMVAVLPTGDWCELTSQDKLRIYVLDQEAWDGWQQTDDPDEGQLVAECTYGAMGFQVTNKGWR